MNSDSMIKNIDELLGSDAKSSAVDGPKRVIRESTVLPTDRSEVRANPAPVRAETPRTPSQFATRTPIPARNSAPRQDRHDREAEANKKTSPDAPSRGKTAVVISSEDPSVHLTPQQLRELTIAGRLVGQGLHTEIVVTSQKGATTAFIAAAKRTGATVIVRDRNESVTNLFSRVRRAKTGQIIGAFVTEPSSDASLLKRELDSEVRIVGDLTRMQQELMIDSTRSPLVGEQLVTRSGLLATDPRTFDRVSKVVSQTINGRQGFEIQGADGKAQVFNVKGGDKIREVMTNFIPDERKENALDDAICKSLGIEYMDRAARVEFERSMEVGIEQVELYANGELSISSASIGDGGAGVGL